MVGIKRGEGGEVEIDDYVPLAFRAASGAGGTGLVLIRDPESDTMAEIKIDLSSGRLVAARLVTFVRRPRRHLGIEAARTDDGLPVFAIDDFATGRDQPRIELTAPIDLDIVPGAAMVRLGDAAVDQVVRCGRARFAFSGGSLCGFGAVELTGAESARLPA